MPNARGQNEDHTYLSIDLAEERMLIHRDYLGHCFRWSHAARLIGTSQRYRSARVLDVGCGCEVPLGKLLYSNRFIPQAYCGIDARQNMVWPEMIERGISSGKLTNWSLISGDASAINEADIGFIPNFVVSFEVVEHIEADVRIRLLKNLHQLCEDGTTFLLSTPNYDSRMGPASNHVDETTHVCLGSMLEACGWKIVHQYGTFASIRDYRDRLTAEYGESGERIFNGLREYYDSNVLATIFAPLFPEQSRNILWEVKKVGNGTPVPEKYRPFSELLRDPAAIGSPEAANTYLGSSNNWTDAAYRERLISMVEMS